MKKISKYWFPFFILASLEGGFALLSLLRVTADPKNSLILGLSASRLFMAAALFAAFLFFAWLAFITSKKTEKIEQYLLPETRPKLFSALNWLSFLAALTASIALFLLRYYDPEKYLPIFERAKPLALYILVFAFQLALFLLYIRNAENQTQPAQKADKKPFLITFAILLSVLLFVALTRIGLTPDTGYWSQPGVAIQSWQLALALIIGFLAFLFVPKLSRKQDHTIILGIWASAVGVWWSVPLKALKDSFYSPYAYPLNKPLPYSDAGFYDYLSQGLLLGEGFLQRIPPRPLYVTFLAGLRSFVGINNYDGIMLGQTLFYALFPVFLYFLGKKLHSRAAGITIAFLGIFREWTNLLVASQTRVSNSRMTLTDIPTALVLSLLALIVIGWLRGIKPTSAEEQKDAAHKPNAAFVLAAFISGGVFGVLLLLRTQSMLILPFIFLLAFILYYPNWKKWLGAVGIFIVGMALSITPWLNRNAQITGKFTFDDPLQIAVLASQYKTEGNLNWKDFDYENESLSNSMLSFALENPGYVANFIATHFLATEINGLLALPHLHEFNSLKEPINIYWASWDGHPNLLNQFLILIYLAIIALGISAAWKKGKWIGLVPLAFNIGYAASNGIARFSGWRYDLPADWVAFFYFGIGFVELLIISASLFNIPAPSHRKHLAVEGFRPSKPFFSFMLASFIFLSLGFSPILLEKNIPQHFEYLSEEELIAKLAPISPEIDAFAAQKDAHALMGRLLYPRYYPRGLGIYSANPWPAYAERDFARMGFILINQQNTQIVFPIPQMPQTFPNGVDVILLGCAHEEYFEARLLYLMEGDESLLSEREFTACGE